MSLKKIKFIELFYVFGLCFLTHFLYDLFPNSVFSIFFPVNESIWEHMKMLFTTFLIGGIITYIILYYKNIKHNNFLASLFFPGILGILIFLIIYLPIYNFTGENFILNIVVLFITICLMEIISYKILIKKEYPLIKWISLVLIILFYIILGILTYNPPKCDLFYDHSNEKYGINIYTV